ncbi:MAG: acylphosphatase [Candidatus Cloacimonadaceae bacterium]|nr:acylphosphatase [Candidatus Cloacimonadaceae bacterium]MDP3114610.1 acylphosphatase [Candidatus Cloacimonadaceae bacterium]
MQTWELIASGRVQGVGFRFFVFQLALAHGIFGYAQNLADGTVKIIASGNEPAIADFCQSVKLGNRHVQVIDLHKMKLDSAEEYHDFKIK